MTTTKLPNIVTSHVYPPIPSRDFDWCAHFVGDEESPNRYGWGPTKALAIQNLADTQIEDIVAQRDALSQELAQWRSRGWPTWDQERTVDRILDKIDHLNGRIEALDAAQAPE